MTDKELQEYFQMDKSDWYVIDEYGFLDWDEEKVNEFWDLLLKHKMSAHIETSDSLDFDSFIFPDMILDSVESFQRNAYWDFNTKKFYTNINFLNCKFLGRAGYPSDKFYKKVSFKNSIFAGPVDFQETIFFGEVSFENVRFEKDVSFLYTKFYGAVNFSNTRFLMDVDFQSAICAKGFQFSSTSIYKYYTTNKKPSIEYINYKSKIDLSSFSVPRGYKFKRINISNIAFSKEQIISELEFVECEIIGPRLKTLNEKESLFDISSLKLLESNYRLLKLKFEDSRDWDLSGKSYRSEMEMKKYLIFYRIFTLNIGVTTTKKFLISILKLPFRIIKNFRHFIEFMIYYLYGLLSGYTQSIGRPLFWLALSTTIIFPFIYSNCYEARNSIDLLNLFSWTCTNYSVSLEKSVAATFPFIDTSLVYDNWWIKSLQTITSTTLLAFFILALRKRFKQ